MIIYRSWFQSYHHHYCLQNFIPIFRFWLSIWCSSLSSFEGCQFHFMFIDSALSSSPFSIVIGILLVVITITIMIIISATLILCSFLRHCQPLQQIGYVIVCGEPRGISGVVSSPHQAACPRCSRDRNQEPCEKQTFWALPREDAHLLFHAGTWQDNPWQHKYCAMRKSPVALSDRLRIMPVDKCKLWNM